MHHFCCVMLSYIKKSDHYDINDTGGLYDSQCYFWYSDVNVSQENKII